MTKNSPSAECLNYFWYKLGSDSGNEQKEISAYQVKLDQLRQDLAVKSRLMGKLERQLDDVPSRYELDQYQRRFFELVSRSK